MPLLKKTTGVECTIFGGNIASTTHGGRKSVQGKYLFTPQHLRLEGYYP